jgi:hypothetical protein
VLNGINFEANADLQYLCSGSVAIPNGDWKSHFFLYQHDTGYQLFASTLDTAKGFKPVVIGLLSGIEKKLQTSTLKPVPVQGISHCYR